MLCFRFSAYSTTLQGCNQKTHTYNADGIRTKKTVGDVTTEYYLDGAKILGQYDGNNRLIFQYDRNDSLVGFVWNGTQYYYVKNLLGDITAVLDATGSCVVNYTYDAWGKVLTVTGDAAATVGQINPFRYRGYYYDSDIQMYYLQSRYYDPEVGRFINCDKVNYIGVSGTQIGYNPFAYCGNDPVNDIDPNGCVGIDNVVGALFGVAFSVVGYFLSILVENYSLLSKGISYINSTFINAIKSNPGSFILDVIFGAISGALSTTNKKKILNIIVAFVDSIRNSRKNGETITGTVVNLIIDFILSSLIDTSQSFSKFNFKKVRNSCKPIITNLKSVSKDKLKSIAKVISNQIIYYFKQNATLYSRYIKKYGLSSAVSWISGEFKQRVQRFLWQV